MLNRFALLVCCTLAFAGCAYQQHLTKGDELLSQGLYESAEAEYAQALKEDPSRPEAKDRLETARRRRAKILLDKAHAASQAQDVEGALTAYAEATRVAPDSGPIAQAYQNAVQEQLVAADADLTASRWDSADRRARAVLRVQPSSARAQNLVAQVQLAAAHQAFQRAGQFERQGKFGNALVEYLRADERMVGATPARERAAAMRQKLREQLAFYVVAAAPTDKSNSPDVLQRLEAGKLAQGLGEAVPFKVVTEAPPQAKGVRLSLSLDRVLLGREKAVRQKTQRYQAGTRSVENPARVENNKRLLAGQRKQEEVDDQLTHSLRRYADSQQEIDHARDLLDGCINQAFAECQKILDACRDQLQTPTGTPNAAPCMGACNSNNCASFQARVRQAESTRDDLRRALEAASSGVIRQQREVQRLRDVEARTPLTLSEPVNADYIYDVELHTQTARAVVTLNLDDLGADPSHQPLTQDFVVSKSDEAHKGYDRYGILADPLQLSPEAELRLEVGDKALADLVQRVKARYEIYRKTVLKEARQSLVRAAAEDAIETLVRAVVVSADQPPKEVLNALAQARGLQRPNALLE